jgi:hypothetical protein
VGLFRRSEPLHERLAREGGLTPPDPRPQWQETGIHGIARPREWDATVTAEAPDLGGDSAQFVALPDGTLLVDASAAEGVAVYPPGVGGFADDASSEAPEQSLEPLANAVEQVLRAPYRARAARQNETLWAVQARRIEVLQLPDAVEGDAIELTRTSDGTTLSIDDMRSVGTLPTLERRGEQEGPEYVVRAERLDGDLWEIHAAAL